MRQGKDQEAFNQFRKALDIKPNYADAYYNLGSLSIRQGKDQEAIAFFLQTLQINSEIFPACIFPGFFVTDIIPLKSRIF